MPLNFAITNFGSLTLIFWFFSRRFSSHIYVSALVWLSLTSFYRRMSSFFVFRLALLLPLLRLLNSLTANSMSLMAFSNSLAPSSICALHSKMSALSSSASNLFSWTVILRSCRRKINVTVYDRFLMGWFETSWSWFDTSIKSIRYTSKVVSTQIQSHDLDTNW